MLWGVGSLFKSLMFLCKGALREDALELKTGAPFKESKDAEGLRVKQSRSKYIRSPFPV